MRSRQVSALWCWSASRPPACAPRRRARWPPGRSTRPAGSTSSVFGKGYRDLWTTPIEVPVLDLQKTGGGLTPVRVVGQAQGLGLAFKGADGRAYTFRSLHKHPERMLPEEWRDRFPAKIAQDQSSHTHPAAGQILASLAEAAGRRLHEPAPRGRARRPGARRVPQDLRRRVRHDRRVPAPGRGRAARLHGRDGDHLHHRAVEALARRPGEPDRQPGLPPGPRPRPLARQLRPPPRAVALDADPRPGAPAAAARGPGHGPRPPRRDGEPGHARPRPEAAQVQREVHRASSRGRSRTTSRWTAGCSPTSTPPPGRRSPPTCRAGSPTT